MSIDAGDAQARSALRVVLGAPLAFAAATWLELPLPYVAASGYVSVAAGMANRPTPAVLSVLVAAVAAITALFSGLGGWISTFPYLTLALAGGVVFVGLRMQAHPKTKMPGLLVTLLGPMALLVTDAVAGIEGVFIMAVVGNVSVAVAVLLLAFMAFPAGPDPTAKVSAPAEPNADLHAAAGAIAVLPLFAVMTAVDAVNALRVLLAALGVLAVTSAGARRRAVGDTIFAVGLAGAAAAACSTVLSFWPVLPAVMLVTALVGLLFARGLTGGRAGMFIPALGSMWPLLITSGAEPLQKTLIWTCYAVVGTAYAVGMRRLVLDGFAALARRSERIAS